MELISGFRCIFSVTRYGLTVYTFDEGLLVHGVGNRLGSWPGFCIDRQTNWMIFCFIHFEVL